MNPSSDMGPASNDQAAGPESESSGSPRANWRGALMDLIAARLALIQLESQDAAQAAARRAVFIGAACGCAFFTWGLLLVSGVSIISRTTDWQWDWVAAGLAALHLLAGVVLAQSAKSSGKPAFPVTRAEFQRDREWIENFNKDKKSND